MTVRDLIPWNRNDNRGMTPMTSQPADSFSEFRRDMDRMFDNFFRDFGAPSLTGRRQAWPSIDVDESGNEYKVTAELPGLEEKDVELTLQDNVLILSGEKRDEREETGEGRYYAERFHGRFSRSIPLPAEVDAEKVAAAFKNGVLTVVLPKSEHARDNARRIPIQKLS